MNSNILIVEDQFIEANMLRIMLEQAGHTISGIARTVEEARAILAKESVDIVLLDIFLKGPLTGIDLAQDLSAENVPFIYLSANSNSSTLEAAKATQPYGFLVKPFRETDILTALDIARYRHKHLLELMQRQELWLNSLLTNIIDRPGSREEKLLQLVKAFRPCIHFDYILVDTDLEKEGLDIVYGFQRVDYDEYKAIDSREFLKKANITLMESRSFRDTNSKQPTREIQTGVHFFQFYFPDRLVERIDLLYDLQSSLWVPVLPDAKTAMSISFYSMKPDCYNTGHIALVRPILKLLAEVIDHIRQQPANGPSLPLPEKRPAPTPEAATPFPGIIGKSPQLLLALDQAVQVAPFDTTVLLYGETGVGKEGVAQSIHRNSHRKHKPFIKINCAAIPDTLIESELFGHEKGAFTGASERRIGKFEQAQGGTILLDEIGEIPLDTQVKLLRVLQEKELERLGGRTTIKIDVRIIAATNRNLYKEVAAGRFRLDLYYRINVFPITVPFLRERKDDIPLLANYFLQKFAGVYGDPPKELTPEAMQQLIDYPWPGNIRELQNVIERHLLMTRGNLISLIELPKENFLQSVDAPVDQSSQADTDSDKAKIVAALKKSNGKVSGSGGAAEILKIPPTTLKARMRKLGISWKYQFD
jgi:DNA-binding NtrC family response regulator